MTLILHTNFLYYQESVQLMCTEHFLLCFAFAQMERAIIATKCCSYLKCNTKTTYIQSKSFFTKNPPRQCNIEVILVFMRGMFSVYENRVLVISLQACVSDRRLSLHSISVTLSLFKNCKSTRLI